MKAWEEQIEGLKTKIKNAQTFVELGTPLAQVASTNTAPINSECPVSGKPVDATKTITYEGKLVAFCCDDCLAEFKKDPKKFVGKLKGLTAGLTPVNKICPVSGKPINPEKTLLHEGKLIAFCCDDCKANFEKT